MELKPVAAAQKAWTSIREAILRGPLQHPTRPADKRSRHQDLARCLCKLFDEYLAHGLPSYSVIPRLRADGAFIHAKFGQKAHHDREVAALPGCEKLQETGFGHTSVSFCNERAPCPTRRGFPLHFTSKRGKTRPSLNGFSPIIWQKQD